MSIQEFSKTLYNHLLDGSGKLPKVSFENNILVTTKQNKVYPSEEFRRLVSQKTGNFHLLIKDSDIDSGDLTVITNYLKSNGIKFTYEGNNTAVVITGLSWSVAGDIAKIATTEKKVLGHVYGSATGMVDYYSREVGGKLAQYPMMKDAITKVLNDFSSALKDYDSLTSSIPKDIAVSIDAKYKKNFTDRGIKFLVELQDDSENSSAGNAVKQKFAQLRKLISAIHIAAKDSKIHTKHGWDAATPYYEREDYKEAINALLQGIGKQGTATNIPWEHLKGSKSIVEFVEASTIASIKGKQAPKEVKSSSTTIKGKKLPLDNSKTNVDKVIRELKKLNEEYKKATYKLASNGSIRNNGRFTNLLGLQNLLNQKLHDTIRANMGTGSSRNVLNYRSGRFAESAKVESLSLSRQGMLTAFYTYMKYPYQTFEPGYRQGDPSSRNPRLLISKSIRDIAGSIITNRMRAVLV